MTTQVAFSASAAAILAVVLMALPASAQEQVGAAPAISESALEALPADVEAALLSALRSGNMAAIADAINTAVSAYPDLAAQIAGVATTAFPAAASVIAGAATAAVIASNDDPVGIVVAITQAVVRASPIFAQQIAVAVYQSLPTSLQGAANQSLIASTVSSAASAANPAATLAAVTTALASASPSNANNLSTPIVTQTPVSGT